MTNKDKPSFGPDGADSYQLVADLGAPSDACAAVALRSIWEHPSVLGPYRLLNQAPDSQPVWTDAPWEVGRTYCGVLLLPGRVRVTFHAMVSRFEPEPPSDRYQAKDTLVLSLSPREIDVAYGFPADDLDANSTWQPETAQVLVDLARHLHRRVPFCVGGVGFEIHAVSMKDTHYDFLIPEEGELRWLQRRKRG